MRLKVSHFPLFGEKRDTRFRTFSGTEVRLNHYPKASNNARNNSNYKEVQRMSSTLLAVDFAPIIAPVLEVLNALLWPCIAIVGAVGTIYCIFLGIKIANGDLTDGEYAARIDVIQDRLALADTLNTEQKVKYSCYYIAVTDRNKTSLMATLSVMRGTLLSGSIEARILKDGQLAEFIALSKKLEVSDGIAVPREVSFRLTSAIQDNRQLSHFVVTGYPLKVPNAWGEELFDLPNTKVVMKLKPVEKSKALNITEKTPSGGDRRSR